MRHARLYLPTLLALALPLSALADKKDPSKSNLPLQLKLIAKKNVYKSDITADDLKKLVEEAKKTGRLPAAPAVDMELEIINRTGKDVEFWFKGDPVQVTLELKGPGAITAAPLLGFTADFRLPEGMKLAAGKSYKIPLTKLQFGFRGSAQVAYWSDPGEYTLSASYQTGISPAPEGLKADESGFARATLKSEPIKIKVEKK